MKKDRRYEDSKVQMSRNVPHEGTEFNKGPQYDSMKSSKRMGDLGKAQGNMNPMVEDIQKPNGNFSQEGFNKTLEYVERQNAFQMREAKDVEKQAYKGRYS